MLGALKWDLGALLLLGLLTLLWSSLNEPTLQPAESPQTNGSRPPDRTEGDVLLLLPATPAAQAAELRALDCSYGWFNALWHHYGAFATAQSDNLSPQILAGRSVVIVPERVALSLPRAAMSALEDFARRGGQLVVELPREGWEPLTGISTTGAVGQARRITSADGLGVHGPLREHLVDTPLTGPLLPTAALLPRPAGPVILEVEEQPGLLVQPLGQGRVYTILFDYACSLTALHQGKPARHMEFGPPGSPRWQPTENRVAHERMLTSHVPYADLLKRALFDRFSEHRPMPRLWPFPGRHMGAVMNTHPSSESTRAALGYADWARKNEGASTIFVAADRFTPSQAAMADQVGAQVGLLWVLGQDRPPLTKARGLGAMQPWAEELNLAEQLTKLEANLGQGRQIRLVQTEEGLWEGDWDATFRRLSAAGLRVDTSFGPGASEHYGYLFGTGMPFYPIDSRGLPLPILEAPYVLRGANINPARLKRMLVNSQNYFHQPLAINVPADAMAETPAAGILLGFRELHDLARAHEHWVTSVGDLIDFLVARRQSVLTSQWSAAEQRLTISVNVLGARLQSAPEGAIASVAFPRDFEGRPIRRVVLDDEDVSLSRLANSGAGDERVLEMPPGRHVIAVYYEPPAPATDEDLDTLPAERAP
ncbi:hypothetical protein DL240_00165 [Lujinxingia litoralis]|uniref:Uncharacterized protein n=1 Tax=Lujinxingia litoralis TaxID=2211119 RepID=A0A328CCW0_9DELT|nr:hypothetical protein DL240_00165 [Lujinxingia litoralis]